MVGDMRRRATANLSRRGFLSGLAASTATASLPAPRLPTCERTGWTLAIEYLFGAGENIRNIGDLQNLFTFDAPWGRINGELQTFQPFNIRNHVFESDNLALVAIADGSDLYKEHGHITSGALITNLTCFPPCIVEITAKLPAGRGIWPSLWLYDMNTGRHDSSEIDIVESQFNAPVGQRDDRTAIYQNDHGPGVGATLGNPGNLDRYGRWWPGGNFSQKYATYSVLWQTDRVTKFVNAQEAVTREFTWTGPGQPNIIVYNSVGSETIDWPGPVEPDTFAAENPKFRIKAIRIFKPST